MLYDYFVQTLFGSELLTLFAFAAIFTLIGLLGRMSIMLLLSLLILYFMVFGAYFFGILIWFPMIMFAVVYFFIQLWNFTQR